MTSKPRPPIKGGLLLWYESLEFSLFQYALHLLFSPSAQLVLAMLRARVRSGMANAKEKGKKVGRPQTTKDDIPAVFCKPYPAFASGNMNVSDDLSIIQPTSILHLSNILDTSFIHLKASFLALSSAI
ncbi:MAG: hypothetical protein J6K32_00450 [Clostridia bacterium]|nr:hypothetical protein [Clostridia bacterium]